MANREAASVAYEYFFAVSRFPEYIIIKEGEQYAQCCKSQSGVYPELMG